MLKDARRLLKDKPEAVLGAKAFIQKSLWWRRSQLSGLLLISIVILGIPAEYFWREEAVKRDYDRIERLGNGDPGERAAVINLAGGCWVGRPFFLVRQYLRERVFGNCRSLQNAKLEKADLSFANLSSANLWGANLTGADLNAANLSGANLGDANLSGANLWGANLSGRANLGDTNLSGAALGGANLSGVFLYGANLSGADFMSANLSGADLNSANLQNAKFACNRYMLEKNQNCLNLKDIRWNERTNWRGIQGWETVENIPPALKKQLKLRNVK